MKLSKSDILIPLAGIFALAILGYLLYIDFTRPGGPGGTKLIGTIVSKSNIAERKYSRDVIWTELEDKSDLYNFDTVRTSDRSQAHIRLKNGTEITLNENSMVLLTLTEDEVGIQFLSGSISATQKTGVDTDERKVSIISGDSTISLEDSDVVLARDGDSKLQMTVNRGTALLQSGDTEQLVLQNQEVSADEEKIRIADLAVRLISPDNNRHIPITGERTPVDFSWETLRGAYRNTLEIAGSISMGDPVASIKAKGGAARVSLPGGVYYWRVIAVNAATKKIETSEIRRFVVVNTRPSNLLLPENGAVIRYREKMPLVNFAWSGNESASGYTITVSKSPDMSSPIIDSAMAVSRVALNLPGEGSYFWKVSTVPDSEQILTRIESAVHRFSVVKTDSIDPPLPLAPADDKSIPVALVEQKGLVVSWRVGPEIAETELAVSRDREFARIVEKRMESRTFTSLTGKLEAGTYYWRLVGVLGDGTRTGYSSIRSFTIVKEGRIALLEPADRAVIQPGEGKTTDVRFTWSDTGLDGQYRLRISRAPDFSALFKDSSIEGITAGIEGFTEGDFFWKVIQMNVNGDELMVSPVNSFTIAGNLAKPGVIAPESGSTIDMVRRDSLDFSWRPVPGANLYRLSLYQVAGGTQRAVTRVETRNASYSLTDLKKLDVGQFIWTIQAMESYPGTNRAKRRSDEVRTPFTITLGIKGSLKIDAPAVVKPE